LQPDKSGHALKQPKQCQVEGVRKDRFLRGYESGAFFETMPRNADCMASCKVGEMGGRGVSLSNCQNQRKFAAVRED
jgi:hypothetical protein